jgi:hypothetical protein
MEDGSPNQPLADPTEAYKNILSSVEIGTIIEFNSHDTDPPSTGELTVVYSEDDVVETTLVKYEDNYWKLKEKGGDLIIGETKDGRLRHPDQVITFSVLGYDSTTKLRP